MAPDMLFFDDFSSYNAEIEGEVEPFFRRLVLRSVSHVIRHYSSSLITESEVFLSMLVKVTALDLPLWHHILVLEILRKMDLEPSEENNDEAYRYNVVVRQL